MRKGTSLKDYIIHGIFFTMYGFVKYIPAPIGNILRYIVVKPFIKKIGSCRIAEGVTLYYPYRISIGNGVRLNEYSFLSGFGGIELKDGVGIGNGVKLFTSEHCLKYYDVPITESDLIPGKIVIEENAAVATNSIVLKNVTIGKNAFIGAGSVVTDDVPPNAISAGSPAKVIKYREKRK